MMLIFFRSVVAIVLSLVVVFSVARAQVTSNRGSGYCTTIDGTIARISDRADDRFEAIRNEIETKVARIDSRRLARDVDVEQTLVNWRDAITLLSGELRSLATTQEQEEAIAEFEYAVDELTIAQEQKMADLKKVFRLLFDQQFDSYRVAVTTAVNEYDAEIRYALNSAKEMCDANPQDSTVRQELQSKLVSARSHFETLIVDITNARQFIEQYVDEYYEGVRAATDDFNTQLETLQSRVLTVF